jgi:hypothetical protein
MIVTDQLATSHIELLPPYLRLLLNKIVDTNTLTSKFIQFAKECSLQVLCGQLQVSIEEETGVAAIGKLH